jgi:hypothetical protein
VLPPEVRNQKPEPRNRRAPAPATAGQEVLPQDPGSPRTLLSSGFCHLTSGSAGHGLLPRRSLLQRTLMGCTALGLGLTVPPPTAGHGVLPSIFPRLG